MSFLLDANVLIALFDEQHVHHDTVVEWLVACEDGIATCPIVEGALVRWITRILGASGAAAATAELDKLAADPRHEFWPDDLPYSAVSWRGVLGHRQVTDGYLAELARFNRGRLATFDRGLAALHPDIAYLVPTMAGSHEPAT